MEVTGRMTTNVQDASSKECSLYEEIEDELYWETVEEYGEEAADGLF